MTTAVVGGLGHVGGALKARPIQLYRLLYGRIVTAVSMTGPPDPTDVRARVRIRDAALVEFAERGFRGATVRSIAARAGVSPALVQHHYGTKDGLRAACHAHVLSYLRRDTPAGLWDIRLGDQAYVERFYREAPIVLRYLARAFVEGADETAGIFDAMVEIIEQHLRSGVTNEDADADLHVQAAVLAAMRMGIVVLHEHISRALGEDPLSPHGGPRVSRAATHLLAPHLSGADVAGRLGAHLDHLEGHGEHAQP
jgi:AcrR family transcriptional regulator